MPVINQLNTSTLSLQGNRINAVPTQPAWGYIDASANLDPAASKLQNTYSVNSIPPVRLKDFNINGVTTVPAESRLAEASMYPHAGCVGTSLIRLPCKLNVLVFN